MLKFKQKDIFNKFLNQIGDITKTTYNDLIKFSEENNLKYGIISFDEDKDTLYIKTNDDECFIETNGEAENCKGKYLDLVENNDYEALNNALNEDAETIINGKLDIVCINQPFVEEE